MSPLWTLDAMAQAMCAERSGALPGAISGISIDSRTIDRGEAFFAIKDARDGHEFVPAALAAGAGLAVVANDKRGAFPKDAPLLAVPDVLEALRDLARASRARSAAKVIGVTGSVGKTGTKEALRLALSQSGSVHASAKSFNNHWGVPLSLANMPKDVRFGVFELGMNHAGEIDALTRLARPHIAIITTVAPVHLGYFRSVDEIADAKAEIFDGLMPGGSAILPFDNPHFDRLEAKAKRMGARILTFGTKDGAWARLTD
ncbi:MAG: Mur ligase family protein, partial [Burkholderiales bacterium]